VRRCMVHECCWGCLAFNPPNPTPHTHSSSTNPRGGDTAQRGTEGQKGHRGAPRGTEGTEEQCARVGFQLAIAQRCHSSSYCCPACKIQLPRKTED